MNEATMELTMLFGGSAVGVAVGLLIAWIWSRWSGSPQLHDTRDVGRLQTELDQLRSLLTAETSARTGAEVAAGRLPAVEEELAAARVRLEDLVASRASLKEQADRVPGLETRIAQLTSDVTSSL
jgi:phage terminase Nu1 subunit (DNA packaging protein)